MYMFFLNLIMHRNMHVSVALTIHVHVYEIQFIIRLAPHAFSICLVSIICNT